METQQPWKNRIVGHADVLPSDLKPHTLRWRQHSRLQRNALAAVLERVGWVDEVIVNVRSGHLINGHLRLALALDRSEPSLPVTYVDLSDEEERLVLATFDPLSGLAEADAAAYQKLVTELGPFDETLDALIALGLQAGRDALSGLRDPDAVPLVHPVPVSRTGDRWQLGEQRIGCGDSTVAGDVEDLFEDAVPTWIWTDPPYGNDYQGKGRQRLTIANNGSDVLETLLSGAFGVADRVLADRSPVYVAHPAGPQSEVFLRAFREVGWHLHQTIVWVKDAAVLGHSDHHYRHEPILYGWRGARARWYGGRDATSVFEVPRPRRNSDHPTAKPIQLVEAHLRQSTRRGDLGYDPFGGSGTTLLAAHRLTRRCFAIEIDPTYVDLVVRRWEAFTGSRAVLLGDGRTFDAVKEERHGTAAEAHA